MSCVNNKNEWTKTTTLRLIELLEERPCLYDPRNKFYSNKHARVNALTTISEKLTEEVNIEISSDEVKKKIANLRSQFNHELAKVKEVVHSGMDTDEMYEPSIWWFPKLKFLKQYIKCRKSKSNLKRSQFSESETLSQMEDEEVMDNTQVTHSECSSDSISPDYMIPSTSTHDNDETDLQTPSKKLKVNNIKNSNESGELITATLTTLQKIQENNKQILQNNQASTENTEFGKYVGKELDVVDDVELLNEAKFEINNILYKYKKMCIQKMKKGITLEID